MLKQNLNYNEKSDGKTALIRDLMDKFPEFIVENGNEKNFDLDKFMHLISEDNSRELKEGYRLNFIGKNYAKKEMGEKPNTVIVPNKEHNKLTTNNNLFFTGDNLEVLKHLQNNYKSKIDLIYIDPPYNTGKDGFVYPDKFEFTDGKLQTLFNLDDLELKRLKSIQGKSNHSAWLTFMYPRLYLAKRILREDGVIFISIDNNEYANIKLILDEIFGEINYIGEYIKQSKVGGGSDSKFVVKEHEYTLIYAKNVNYLPEMFVNHDENYLKRYKEEDEIGKYFWDTLARPGLSNPIYYDIKMPDGTKINKGWIWSEKRFEKAKADGDIKITQKNNGEWSIQFKQRLNSKGKKPRSMTMDFGGTVEGKNEIKNLLNNDKVFSYPKSTTFIKKLLETVNIRDNAIILDFFAGSGTTADAVMQYNKEKDKNMKYILVQLPEPTFYIKDGYKTPLNVSKQAYENGFNYIDELSRKRIIEANKKITKNNIKEFNFKHYYVTKPGKETIEKIKDFENLELNLFDNMIDEFSANALNVEGEANGKDTILTTWLVQDNYDFEVKINKMKILDYSIDYVLNDRVYLIEEGWRTQHTKEIINLIGQNKLMVQSIVIYGYSFGFEEIRELEIALTQLDKKVNLIKRY
ncbi:site-specific DNA-methyltransferase [Staphylococcus sp. GDK8D64P]|uniref:site-specific DNA-methyltransferase n=1 Tax=Staphylococcus sp. GDK8D64P TaxID=2804091 RepID=UPI001AEC2B1A|nr:site-specific DNA-methyltransferase [Staphylococcus sp. GDK8D64P]